MKKQIENAAAERPSWFANWFDSAFYHQLYASRDEKEASAFIDHLLDELQPDPRSFMLDLGCGAGRHSKHLAAKGYDVTGIDLAASSIREAKKSESALLKFYRHDMRMSLGHQYFDYVFNFFTSFGYFKNDHENNLVVANISHTLKNGGTLVMDYLNVEYAENHLVPAEIKEIDGIIYTITRWHDDNFFFKKICIDNMGGEPLEFTEQVAKFHVSDFNTMFEKNGLQIKKVFGDYHLDQYHHSNSPRLIMIAEKI